MSDSKFKQVNKPKCLICIVNYIVLKNSKVIYKDDYVIDRATPFSPNGKFLTNAVSDFLSMTKKNFGADVKINFSLKFFSEVFYA